MGLLPYFMLWFGLLFAMVLIVGNIATKVFGPAIRKWLKRFEKHRTAPGVLRSSGQYLNRERLLAHFVDIEGNNQYRQMAINGAFSYSLFNKLIKEAFAVEILSEICEWNRSHCIHCIKLADKAGKTVYITYQTTKDTFWSNDKRTFYKMVQESGLTPEFTEENRFEMMVALQVLVPGNTDDNANELALLYDTLRTAEIERIPAIEEKTRKTTVNRFALGTNGFYLQETDQEIPMYPDEVLNNSYNDQKFVYKGESYDLKPAQQLSIATTALLNKQNVFVFGTMGCGKTTFARQILAKLQEEEGIQLVSINPSMISQLQNPAAQSAFVNLLSKTYEDIEYDYATDDTIYIKKRVKNIIFIDEAENLLQKTENGIHSADQAFLLSLMDGELRDILNCQVLFVFNKDKEFLNPAIFRSVRAGVEFHVTPITMERAKKLVTLLKESNLRLRFDAEKFHQFITDVSKDSSGRMYAAAGFTTLADVVSCFTEPELDDAIIEALRGMRIPPKKETTVQTVSTVKAIPAPPKPIVASKGGSPAPPPTAITPVPAVPGLPTKTEQKKKKRRRR